MFVDFDKIAISLADRSGDSLLCLGEMHVVDCQSELTLVVWGFLEQAEGYKDNTGM